MKLKVFIATILFLAIAGIVIFLLRGEVWHYKIEASYQWDYAFFDSSDLHNGRDLELDLDWKKSDEKLVFPQDLSNYSLSLRTEIEIDDRNSISEVILEIPKNYAAVILINGHRLIKIEQGLITSNTNSIDHEIGLEIDKHWEARKVFIDKNQVDSLFKNGKNKLEILFADIHHLRSVRAVGIPLVFRYNFPSSLTKENEFSPRAEGQFKQSSLPILKIETNGKAIVDDPKIQASLSVINSSLGSNLFDDEGYNIPIRIEHRGFTSLAFLKKSYGFVTCNQSYDDSLVPLLGLPKESSWVLYGPYKDRSLVRNAFTFDIYAKTGNYSPRTRMLELIVNDNYQGVYLLTEKIKIGPSRLNIPQIQADEMGDSSLSSGGYIVEIDRNEWMGYIPENEADFIQSKFELYSPKMGKMSNSIQEKIRQQYLDFEDGVINNETDRCSFDTLSFVDYVIISELSKNVDAYRLSTFVHNRNIADSLPKFFCGPIWDFNYAWGLPDYNNASSPQGHIYPESEFVPTFWKMLIEDPQFKEVLNERYSVLRQSIYSDDSVDSILDSLYMMSKLPAQRNFQKWSVLGNHEFEPNHYTGARYKDEFEYLRSWIHQRLDYLDSVFVND